MRDTFEFQVKLKEVPLFHKKISFEKACSSVKVILTVLTYTFKVFLPRYPCYSILTFVFNVKDNQEKSNNRCLTIAKWHMFGNLNENMDILQGHRRVRDHWNRKEMVILPVLTRKSKEWNGRSCLANGANSFIPWWNRRFILWERTQKISNWWWVEKRKKQ